MSFRMLLGGVLSIVLVASAQAAVVLTFDDIANPGPVPDGYGGLNWDNFSVLNGASIPGSGYVNGVSSSPKVAYNDWGQMATVEGPAFDFRGAYLTGVWNDNLQIDVVGYVGSDPDPVYLTTVFADFDTKTWFSFDFSNVTKVEFISSGGSPQVPSYVGSGEQFAMDDFTFGEADANVVPEPSSIVAWSILSLAGLVLAWRRRR